MKIAHINTFSNGSTGKIARGLIAEAKKNGDEGKLFYARGPIISDVPSINFSSRIDIYLHGIASRMFDSQGLHSKSKTKKLIKLLKEYDPDVIHLHNLHGYYLNYPVLFSYLKESGKQIRWTLHDCWAFTGHCAYFSYIGCEKWKTECRHCPQKDAYPKAILLDCSRRNFVRKQKCFTSLDRNNMVLITPSQWLADLVGQSFLGKYQILVQHNKIDRNVFYPRDPQRIIEKYDLQGKKVILGVASVWDERKGLKYFVQLDKKIDHNRALIVIVGVSEKQRKKLLKETRILPILRTNDQEELAELYSAADVFFNPTMEENYPTVNLEAQACGTKVLSFDTGGCKETDTGNGLLRLTHADNYIEDIISAL